MEIMQLEVQYSRKPQVIKATQIWMSTSLTNKGLIDLGYRFQLIFIKLLVHYKDHLQVIKSVKKEQSLKDAVQQVKTQVARVPSD